VSDAVRRAVLIVGILAVVVGIAAAGGGSARVGAGADNGNRMTTASASGVTPAGVETSAWFCAGATGAGGDAQPAVLLTNPTARTVTGTITTVSTVGAPTVVPVTVPARTQIAVAPAPGVAGGSLASTVALHGGGVGVTQIVSGPLGFSSTACASTTAGHWYFADASTVQGDTLSLSLFNPTDTVAVVDVSFVTSTGVETPPAYQGIDVPGGSVEVENVADHVLNNPDVATIVTTLSGQVVAAELEAAGPAGSGGLSDVLGATTPATTWTFAQNTDVTTGDTVFHVFNPSGAPARVTVEIGLQQGAAEPLVLRVPAESVSVLDTRQLTRIPADTPFAVTFVSAGGIGIVVDRHVSSPPGAPQPAVGDVAGAAGGGVRWLLPAEYTPSTGVSALAVVDLGRAPVTVRLSVLSPTAGLVAVPSIGGQRVRSGTPLIISAAGGSPLGTEPMELVSSGPVAVELDAVTVGSPGVVVSPALPVG
jgi:hypothetical protein